MYGYPDQVPPHHRPMPYPVAERHSEPVPPPRPLDMAVSALLWLLPAFLAMVSAVMAPWFLLAGGVCEVKPSCTTDPTLGGWVIVAGGVVGFLLGASASALAARNGRPMYPGALLGVVLVLMAWLVGSLLM